MLFLAEPFFGASSVHGLTLPRRCTQLVKLEVAKPWTHQAAPMVRNHIQSSRVVCEKKDACEGGKGRTVVIL